ncbi:MAG: hypothetical protein ACRD4S_16965 [Candidatus Acidiferrales bacterium]
MADAPDVKISLSAEDQGVSAAIKELTSQLKSLKGQQDTVASSAGKLSGALRGIASAAAVGAVIAFGKSVFDAAANIAKMSQITGASTQALSVFHAAAEENGIASEQADKGIIKLSKSIFQLQQGLPQAAAAFAQIGLSQKSFAGLNTDQKILLVTNAIAKMKDGTTKAAVAQQLMGRSGAELIPILNSLSGEGYQKLYDQLKKAGLLMDDQSGRAILALKASLAELSEQAQGAALQFEEGLLPAVSDVAAAISKSFGGPEGFKSVGEAFGTGLRYISEGFLNLGAIVGAVFAHVNEDWDFLVNHTREAGKSVLAAAEGYIAGGVGGAAAAGAQQLTSTSAGQDFADRSGAIDDQLKKQLEQNYLNTIVPGGAGPVTAKKPGAGSDTVNQSVLTNAAAKAQLALVQKQMEDELALWKAKAAEQQQIDQSAYDQGLISLKQYFEDRRTEVQTGTDKEIAILEKERAAARADAAKSGAQAKKAATPQMADKLNAQKLIDLAKVDELNTRIAEKQIESRTKIKQLDDEQQKAKEANHKKLLQFQEQILEAEGRTYDAAVLRIKDEADDMRKELVKLGANPAQAGEFEKAQLGKASFDETDRKNQQQMQAFENQKRGIQLEASTGHESPLAAERQINELIRQRLPLLRQQAEAELAAAKAGGNQDEVATAQNRLQSLNNLGVTMDGLHKQLTGALSSDFNSFFQNLQRGSETVGMAFRSLASSILASFAKILEQKLMMKLLGGGEGGGSSTGFAGMLGSLFAPHAEGGLISGPGGPKSDKIPAMLSNGEFVMSAKAVQNLGHENLAALNKGIRPPSIAHLHASVPRFSDGGLVGASSGTGSGHNLIVGLEEGLVLKHLSSKNAGKVIVQQLANNPKAAGKALSRSQ